MKANLNTKIVQGSQNKTKDETASCCKVADKALTGELRHRCGVGLVDKPPVTPPSESSKKILKVVCDTLKAGKRDLTADELFATATKYRKALKFDKALYYFQEATQAGHRDAATKFFEISIGEIDENFSKLTAEHKERCQAVIAMTKWLAVAILPGWVGFFAKHLPSSHINDLHIYGDVGGVVGYLPKTLTALNMNDCGLKEKEIELFASQQLPNLRWLDLGYNPIGNEGLKLLSQCNFSNLEKLYLRSTGIGALGLKELFKQELPKLTVLQLDCNDIGDEGCKIVAEQAFPKLQCLMLSYCKIGDEGLKALADNPFKKLHTIGMAYNAIGDSGLATLAQLLAGLRSISLQYNKIGAEGAKALAKYPFNKLVALNLYNNNIGDEGFKAIAKSLGKTLTHLDIGKINIGAEGLDALTNQDLSLQKVYLHDNSVGDEAVLRFVKKFAPTLKFLHLNDTNIGEKAEEIAKTVSEACHLHLAKNNIPDSVWKTIMDKYKNCYFV